MKKLLLAVAALFAAGTIFAQSNSIPNPGFENWTVINFQDPTGYQGSNDGNNGNSNSIPVINVTRTTNAYHGNYAVQLKTTKVGADTVASYAAIGNPGGGGSGNTGGAAMSGTPTGIRLYYTYTKKALDSALIFVVFKKAGATIGQYEYLIYDTTSSYQLFSQLFSPALSAAPDTVIFAFASSVRVTSQNGNNSSGYAPGAVFQIDSVTFTGVATQPTNFNGDFENWQNDSTAYIQGWNYWEGSDSGNATRTTDAFAGKYAVQLTTGTCSGCGGTLAAPQGITNGATSNNSGPHGGLPYTMTKDTLEFYYKYTPAPAYPGDTAMVSIEVHNNNSSNQQWYNIYLTGTGGSYVKEDFPFQIGSFTPDSVLIDIQSSYSNRHTSGNGIPAIAVGSTLKIDNMRFLSQVPIAITPANPSYCAGGSVALKASGATSYTWAPNTNLSATTGSAVTANPFSTTTYTVTGTTGTATGTQTVVVVVNNAPTVNINPSAPSICIGNSVSLTASGTAVSYAWSPSTTLTASTGANVTATPTISTTYTVTGTSAAGCTGANSVSVVVNTVPTLSVTPSAPGICAGGGAVNIKATGATTYFWSPAAGLNVTTGGNVNATPTVTTTYKVVGKNGACADSTYVKVIIDKAVTVNLTTTNVTCNGACDGTSLATPVGGISPYSYSWSNGSTVTKAAALCPGTYTVTVNDSIGCAGFATATIIQPTALSASTIPVNTTCGQSNGQGIANANGGTSPYTYSWNSVPVQTTQTATALAAGNYTLTVTDANNCTTTANLVINASTAPSINVKVTSSNCGINTGMAVASVTGGTTPYNYSWNNGSTTSKDSGLGAGVYIITVTDHNGCSSFKAITVSDTNGPTISSSTVVENKCSGQSNGSVSIVVTNGTKPYHYVWSNGSTSTSIGGLQAGPYQVTVSDGGGCSIVKSFTITSPAPVTLTTNTTQAGCGVSNGSASVTASGGTAPYFYKWSNAATTTSVSSVGAGTYGVLVTDNNGCKDSTDASVSNASGPVATISSLVNVNCSTGVMGSISVSDSGGSTPYTYLWSNGATTSSIDSLSAGNYNVVVTDAGGCKGTTNATIGQVLPPAISICMVTVDPSSENNTIVWDKSSTKKIASYNIYKESTAPGVYSKIGSVKADTVCQFVDLLSNSLVQSWRYEISQVDSCGGESPLSLPHKTMHLTINVGATGGYNLIWDNYQGLAFSKYYVYRDVVSGVASNIIDSVLNNGNYTYSNTPPQSGTYYYHMGIDNPGGCTPSIKAINYNASKSNTGTVTFVGIPAIDAEINSFDVFPNPNTGMFNLNISLANRKQQVDVRILNTMGQVMYSDTYHEVSGNLKKQIDLSAYSKGIYLVQIITPNGSMYRKVVIQ